MKTDPKATAARAFVRSLNILLKFARLYGHDHARVVEQLAVAWSELRTAIPEGAETGLLLGASGAQLLLDGVPLEGSPAEKQFAQLLSAAGLASVQFTQQVTEAELARFMHAFPTGKAKPAELAEQLKTAIADAQGIRVNEVCFVATDSRLKESSMAAQIAAASMGDQQDQFRKMLNDPKKLLELIAAAEGSKTSGEGALAEREPAPEREKDGGEGPQEPRAAWKREARLVALAEAKQAGVQDLVLGAAQALAECGAELEPALQDPEVEQALRGQRVEQAWAKGPAKEAARVGEAADQGAERVKGELETGRDGARGLAVASGKGRVAAAGCLEARMTNRFIESCTRWRRLGALERARIHPRRRWSFRTRCRNCLARRRRR